jgi:hypothetical protein
MENTPFCEFTAGLHHQNHPVAVGGIPISSKLAAIFARLEFAGFLYSMHFAGESPGCASLKSGRPTFIHRQEMGLASSGI